MSLDIFESPFHESLALDNNNLLFVQDGISVYGFETNTGLKIIIGTASKENISEELFKVSALLSDESDNTNNTPDL